MYPLAPVTHIVWSDGEAATAAAGWDKVVNNRPEAADPAALFRKSRREEAVTPEDSSDKQDTWRGERRVAKATASGNKDVGDFILPINEFGREQ